jgi:hypothetical protein
VAFRNVYTPLGRLESDFPVHFLQIVFVAFRLQTQEYLTGLCEVKSKKLCVLYRPGQIAVLVEAGGRICTLFVAVFCD